MLTTPDQVRTTPSDPEALRRSIENQALAERRSFAIRADNLFRKLEDDFMNDGDSTGEKIGTFLAVERKKIRSGLEKDDMSGTSIFPFLVLAATHGTNAKENLASDVYDKDLRPETEARMKTADEFFMKGAAMVFQESKIATEAIPNKLALMHKRLEDRLKLPGAADGLGVAVLALNFIQRDARTDLAIDPTVLLDRIQKASQDLNDSIMEYNQTALIPRLADNPAPQDRQRLMTDAQNLARILYELRLIEDALKEKIPKDVSPLKSDRDRADALRETITATPAQVVGTKTPESVRTPTAVKSTDKTEAIGAKEHPLDKWLNELIAEDNAFAERPQAPGESPRFTERRFAPILESLVKMAGSQEKARQTFEAWMNAIDKLVQENIASGNNPYTAENKAVQDFLASHPSLFNDAFEAGKRLQDERAGAFRAANRGAILRVNLSPAYVIDNLYNKFKKRKQNG